MKKIALTLIALCLFVLQIFAQAPQSFKYQSVVRDTNGNTIQNQSVDFRISILQTTSSGTSVYSETFSVTTNNFGLVNLEIGTGTVLSGTFSSINWDVDKYYLQVELDPNGNGYQLMGVSQLLSVPYALSAGNVNYNDTSTTNEIQAISFSGDTLYLSNGNSVYLGNYSNIWQQNGNDIYYNNGYVGVGLTDPHGKLIVKGDASIPADSAIFEVRNKDGQVVFAVYQEGVRIYVDDTGTKAISSKGGFAVGGFNATKSLTNEYMRVTPDSVRIYIKENSGSKSITTKGGFAVGGFNATKTTPTDYFNISASDSAGTIPIPGEARVMWYPLKEAFLAGRVVIEQADSVGLNSFATGFQSKALGNYSQALGYQARAKGNNSSAIGNYANAEGNNSYAFGNHAYTQNERSYAIGSGAEALGSFSFAVGSIGVDSTGSTTPPTIANGNYSYAIGMGSTSDAIGAFTLGTKNIASGAYSLAMGYHTTASGDFSTSMGLETHATGKYSTAIGIQSRANGKYSFVEGYYSEANAICSIAMGKEDTANGDISVALGYLSVANGDLSVAIGNFAKADGAQSVALGQGHTTGDNAFAINGYASGGWAVSLGGASTGGGSVSSFEAIASGSYGIAFGYMTKASELMTVALGSNSEASGSYSATIGRNNLAIGKNSVAIGSFTTAKAYCSIATGTNNDEIASSSTSFWFDTDPVFIVGNGHNNKHNALTILKNGDMFLTKSGSNTDNLRFRTSGSAYDIDFFNHNLYFSGYNSSTQLVAMMIEYDSGNIGVGTTSPDKKLTVNGDMRVTNNIYYGASGSTTTYTKPDFVFKPDYTKGYGIDYIEKYINRHGHLPWVTAAKDEKNGINMTRLSFQTLEAVENQQLQIIEIKKENKILKKQNKNLTEKIKEIDNLKAEIEQLKQVLEIKAEK